MLIARKIEERVLKIALPSSVMDCGLRISSNDCYIMSEEHTFKAWERLDFEYAKEMLRVYFIVNWPKKQKVAIGRSFWNMSDSRYTKTRSRYMIFSLMFAWTVKNINSYDIFCLNYNFWKIFVGHGFLDFD